MLSFITRSIRNKIFATAGFCLLLTASALIWLAMSNSQGTQAFVHEQAGGSAERSALMLIEARVASAVTDSEATFAKAVDITQMSARLIANESLAANPDMEGAALLGAREAVREIMRNDLNSFPEYFSRVATFLPQALDGLDDTTPPDLSGTTQSGAFAPSVLMGDSAPLFITIPDGELSNSTRLSTGEISNDFYHYPRRTGKVYVTGASHYEDKAAGINAYFISINALMKANEQIIGVYQTVFELSDMSKLAKELSSSLYGGQGQVALVSHYGRIVAHSGDSQLLLKQAQDVFPSLDVESLLSQKREELKVDESEEGMVTLFRPIKIAGTDFFWGILVEVPKSLVFADSIKLEQELKSRATADAMGMLITSIVIVALALVCIVIIAQRIAAPVVRTVEVLRDLAEGDGDLTYRMPIEGHDESAQAARELNKLLEGLQALVKSVVHSAELFMLGADQSMTISNHTNQGVLEQKGQIDQLVAAITEMNATSHDVADNASSTAVATSAAKEETAHSQQVVVQTVASINQLATEVQATAEVINQLEDNTNGISAIVEVIRSIAEQTNLLALNAAIEAARAGEQGRGFAVVADEVRTLANRTNDATMDIQTRISELQTTAKQAAVSMRQGAEQAEQTVARANEANSSLEQVIQKVDEIDGMSLQIAAAAEEQSAVSEDVTRNITVIGDISDTMAEDAHQAQSSSQELSEQAKALGKTVSRLKV